MSSFQISGIAYAPFEALFSLSDEALRAQGMARCTVTKKPSFPCRVSLEDAEVGEEVLLLNYEHQPAGSPFRASGPIYVRHAVQRCTWAVDELTPYVTSRLISLRAYDAAHCMVSAEVFQGSEIAAEAARQLDNTEVAYLHLHNARRGCFFCRVDRA